MCEWDFDNSELDYLYRCKFCFETEIKTPSIFMELDEDYISDRKSWIIDINSRINDSDYQEWKQSYIKQVISECQNRNEEIFVCQYSFLNVGTFTEYLCTSSKCAFEEFISKNITADMGCYNKATKTEIETYAGLYAIIRNYCETTKWDY